MAVHYVRAPRQNLYLFITRREMVRDARLSYRARGVLARLLSNADGFSMTAADLAAQGREGRDAIRTALRELRDARYLVKHARTDGRGRFSGSEVYVYEQPVKIDDDGRSAENPRAGFPPAEMPPFKSSKSIIEGESSSRQAAGAHVACSDAAAAIKKVRRQRQSGIVLYEPEDSVADAERIENEYGRDEIGAAIAAIPPAKEPVPGVVERLILRRRREAQEDARRERWEGEQRRCATEPCEDRETARRKAEAQMEAYRSGK